MLKTQGLIPVTTQQGEAVAAKMGAQYMECSSKEMTGVEEIFERAILTVVANDRKTLEAEAVNGGGSVGDSSSGKKRGRSGTVSGQNIPGVGLAKKRKSKCLIM